MPIDTTGIVSEVTQAVIAIIVIGGDVYAVIANLPAASVLTPIAALILGFYFGTKTTAALVKTQLETATKNTQSTLTKGP